MTIKKTEEAVAQLSKELMERKYSNPSLRLRRKIFVLSLHQEMEQLKFGSASG
jgi:hypothetical protein